MEERITILDNLMAELARAQVQTEIQMNKVFARMDASDARMETLLMQIKESNKRCDARIAESNAQIKDSNARVDALIAESNAQIKESNARVDALIAESSAQIKDSNARCDALIAESNAQIKDSNARVDARIAESNAQIKESNKRVDALIAESSAQIKDSNARCDALIAESNAEIKESNARCDALIAESNAQIKESNARIEASAARMEEDTRRMKKAWGDLANKMGTVAEDVVAPNIPRLALEAFEFGKVDDLMVRVRRTSRRGKKRQSEWDVVCSGPEKVIAVDVKSTPTVEKIRDIPGRLSDFFEFFPEYEGRELIGIFASWSIDPKLLPAISEAGLWGIAMGDETMDIVARPNKAEKI